VYLYLSHVKTKAFKVIKSMLE